MHKYLVLFLLFAFSANAKSPELIGQYDQWQVFYYNDDIQKLCYIRTAPVIDDGKYTQRGDIYVTITTRPNDDVFNAFSINGGYIYKKGSKVELQIGGLSIDNIFAQQDTAWPASPAVDKQIVAAMHNAQRFFVKAINSNGVQTKDTYSLKGFKEAYLAMSDRCKK